MTELQKNTDDRSITITSQENDQRLDKFLRKLCKPYTEITLSDIFSWIRKWHLKINGRKQKENYRLQEGDILTRHPKVRVERSFLNFAKTKKEKIKELDIEYIKSMIIYEDDNRIGWNKPPNLVMHPWPKHVNTASLHDYMMSYLKQTGQKSSSETFVASFCHRLDKDTSGLVISAKTYDWLKHLNEQIRERNVSKIYHAIVIRHLQQSELDRRTKHIKSIPALILDASKTVLPGHIHSADGIHIKAPLYTWYNKKSGRSQTFVNTEHAETKEAHSIITPVHYIDHPELWPLTLVQVEIKTGRMHQIRVHAAHIWFPVIGDLTYGIPALNRKASKKASITRQLLHASMYTFQGLDGETIEMKTYMADDMKKVMMG